MALGIGTFGPAGVTPGRPDYGYITTTPKPGWKNVDLLGQMQKALDHVPSAFDTDVNAAALAESTWGAGAKNNATSGALLYYTFGTGVGGGFVVNDQPLHGLVHPEMGHVRIPHDTTRDPFPGACPFHGNCFEGLASGTAIGARWEMPAHELPDDHPAWELQAEYVALAVCNSICTLSPETVVLGGSVMKRPALIPLVRTKVAEKLNGYIDSPAILTEEIDSYIVPPALGDHAGLLGGIALGMRALAAARAC